MMRKYTLSLILLVILIWQQPVVAQPSPLSGGSVVLEIENQMDYIRAGWQTPLPVQAGTFINVDDLVFPQDTSLLLLCPDGSIKDFVPGELFPNDKLNCQVSRENWIVNVDGIRRWSVQRGGRQDPTLPYLITPRGTLVRNQQLELRWNAPPDVLEYQVRIFGGGTEILPLTSYFPEDVTDGDTAVTQVTLELEPDTNYAVEICVIFQNLRQGCTTDPGWAAGTNLAFYYLPDPQLGNQSLATLEENILTTLGADTPESLYARAVLLTQSREHDLGFNSEAIELLNRLVNDFPDSPLAESPDVYIRLGNLYRDTELPLSAAYAFQRATELSASCTDSAALAYLGLALTTPNSMTVVDSLNESLEHHHCLMQPDAFAEQFAFVCELVGDTCAELMPLETYEGQS